MELKADEKKKEEKVTEEDEEKAITTSTEGCFSLVPPKQTCFVEAFSTFLVVVSFEALQNLQSSLNNDKNVGVLSLALIYVTVTICSPLGPVLIRIFDVKNTLLLCFSAIMSYTVGNFYPTHLVVMAASILTGIGMSNLGMIVGLYLVAASKSYLYKKQLPDSRFQDVLSVAYGCHSTFFLSSHVIGNCLASVFFFSSGYSNVYLDTNKCGAWIDNGVQNETVIERPEARVVYTLLGVFILCGVTGIVIAALFLPRLDQYAGDTDSISERVLKCLKVATCWKFACYMSLGMAQALYIMTVYTGYTKNFVSCTIGIKWVGYVMMCFGATGSLTAMAGSSLTRYVGRTALIITFITIDVGCVIFMLTWTPHKDSYTFTFFLVPALTGVSEAIAQPQLNSFIATVFKNSEVGAFSSVTSLRAAVFAISLATSEWVFLYHRLITMLVLYTLGVLGYMVLEVYIHLNKETSTSKCSLLLRKVFRLNKYF